jgi:hypothetical protein
LDVPFRANVRYRALVCDAAIFAVLLTNGVVLWFVFIEKCMACGGCRDNGTRLDDGCWASGDPDVVVGVVVTVIIAGLALAKLGGHAKTG